MSSFETEVDRSQICAASRPPDQVYLDYRPKSPLADKTAFLCAQKSKSTFVMVSRPAVALFGAACVMAILLNLPKISRIVHSKSGGFSNWADWSQCTASCGGGRTARIRNCTNPKPSGWGKPCTLLGPSYEIKICQKVECPIDGAPGAWIAWGPCDHQCGAGLMTRTRLCDTPKPQFGGLDCDAVYLSEKATCPNMKPCPIDGKWGDFSAFSACSVTCGKGTQKKTRSCNKPAPQHGGKPCPNAPAEETQPCNLKDCVIVTNTTTAPPKQVEAKKP